MDGCIYRTKDGECDLYEEGGKFTAFCDMGGCKGRKLSNGDKIRAMSDEELAEWFDLHASEPLWCVLPECLDDECVKCILKWLKSPVEENE